MWKLIVAFVVMSGVLVGGGQAFGQRPKKDQPAQPTVGGVLEAVDSVKSTITLSIFSRKDAQSTDKVFEVAKNAKILRDGAPTKLADLKTGARATLQLAADQKTAVTIIVAGRTVSGEFFDAGKRTITLVVEARGNVTKNSTFILAKDAKITLAGKAARLQDLAEGTRVILTFAADRDEIVQVQTAAPGGRKENE
jgi:hypothetical protein